MNMLLRLFTSPPMTDGSGGKPEYDIDWDHDHGQGSPHGHNWDGDVEIADCRSQLGLAVELLDRIND